MKRRVDGGWIGFLAAAFLVVGLTGIFASYAVSLPLERAMLREAVLDQALAAGHAADPARALAALQPQLDDSASAVLSGAGDLDARVQRERVAMRQRFTAEAEVAGNRIRLLIIVITLTAGAFGVILLGARRTGHD